MISKNRVLISTMLLFGGMLNAQIIINTGNSEMDKYLNDNPGTEIFNGGTTTTPPATTQPVKVTTATPVTPVYTEPVKAEPVKVTTTVKQPAQTNYNYSSINSYEATNDMPPSAEPGKCYARCFIPDSYTFREEQVVDKPASYKKQVIPATYRTVFDTVVVKPASVKKIVTPAVYETVSEKIMVSPATTRWEKGKADQNCLSANPADCQVMCLVEVPAVYKTVTRKVVKTPEFSNDLEIPAEFKIVSRQVVDEPQRTIEIEIPATYKTVMRKELSQKGGYQSWREILCSDKLTTGRIEAIQRALRAEGYDPGPIDNVFGSQTKVALLKFQKDKGLPQGNLNMETLRALNVE